MKTLEEKYGFRLCIHYRDFPVGGAVMDAIENEMLNSREIIVVISDAALKSKWCGIELKRALELVAHRDSTIIIICLGKIKHKSLYPFASFVLNTFRYLLWSDKKGDKNGLFWSLLVDKLYGNDNVRCCCPAGPNALKYDQIIDVTEDSEVIL
jgi:toll-like receptor 13